MKHFNTLLIAGALLCVLPLSSCRQNQAEGMVHFQDREINIKAFLTDFPYQPYSFSLSEDCSKLFYLKTDTVNSLLMLDLTSENNLDAGVCLSDIDFSKRNFWNHRYNTADSCLYWIGDEKNDEIINIWRLNLQTGAAEKLTDVPYIYGWGFNPAGTKIAYVARLGQNESRLDELRILDLLTLKETVVYCDTPAFRMTWTEIAWQPDEKGVLLSVLKNADRTFSNIGYVNFEDCSLKILTDTLLPASLDGTEVIPDWYSSGSGFFLSDQTGYPNVYSYNIENKQVTQITRFERDTRVEWIDCEGQRKLLAVQNAPAGTKMLLIDPATGQVLCEETYPAELRFAGNNKDRVYLYAGAVDIVFQLWAVSVSDNEINREIVVDLPGVKKEEMITSTVERLTIPSFDRDLHAYLLIPKKPLEGDKSMVMIQSFYGGSNEYDMEHQIFTEAGIYVLSPSPRGSGGFGRDFAALNDKDLGGNEIVDIIYCARYISEKLGIPPERIGVFGMSHGGYATMRLMTFPGTVNGITASFPFAFGVAVAGFSDIIYEHNHSNIPDWTFLEAGDPVKDSVRLQDRSPINHAEKITGPLLLIHGNHDNRVNIEGSRMMYKKLMDLKKPVDFLEVEGQGHGFKGLENNMLYYKTIFSFLEKAV